MSSMFLASIMATAAVSSSVYVIQDVYALKGEGVSSSRYGSATAREVCGDRLCSEIPGGYDAWKDSQGTSSKVGQKAVSPSMSSKSAKSMTMSETMKKIHSWKTVSATIVSSQDPGIGHESHQLAIILPPSDKVYKGILTYDASEPIQLVALHGPLAEGEDMGQKIWTPDGTTKFALTFVDNKDSMGTWAFAGNALAVHTLNEDPFTISYSVVAGKN